MNEHELEAGLRRIMKPDTDDTAVRRVLTRLENLPPHEGEEGLVRGGLDGCAHQDPPVAGMAVFRPRLEQQ